MLFPFAAASHGRVRDCRPFAADKHLQRRQSRHQYTALNGFFLEPAALSIDFVLSTARLQYATPHTGTLSTAACKHVLCELFTQLFFYVTEVKDLDYIYSARSWASAEYWKLYAPF